jgi:hypothetical protein
MLKKTPSIALALEVDVDGFRMVSPPNQNSKKTCGLSRLTAQDQFVDGGLINRRIAE